MSKDNNKMMKIVSDNAADKQEEMSVDFRCLDDVIPYFSKVVQDPELALFDNQPDGYYLAKEGLYGTDRAGEPRLIMAGHIIPVGLAAEKGEGSGLSVVFYCQSTNGVVSQEIVPVAEVLSRGEVVCRHFAGKGLIPMNSISAMNEYFRASAALPLKRYRLVSRHGWQPGTLCFMHGKHAIKSAQCTDIQGLIPSASYNPAAGISVLGTLQEWQKNVLRRATGNMQKLTLWIAFSSYLLDLLDVEGVIYHFYGQSSVGKTALLQLAASVNGNGSEPGCGGDSLILSWNTTPNALEMILEQRNHITALIDELGVYKGSKMSDAIYAVAGGKGKSRMSGETLKNVEPASWLLNIISSGEISMQERLRESGEAVKAGMLHRSIDLHVTQEHVRSCAEESSSDCGHRIEQIKENSALYYGTAGRAFIESLINLFDDESKMRRYVKELYEYVRYTLINQCELRGYKLNNVQKRLLGRFAVPGTAGLLAQEFGILKWDEEEIINTLITCFDVWMAEVQPESDPMLDALLCLQNFLNIEYRNMGDSSRNPHIWHHSSVCGCRLPEQQILVLGEAIDNLMRPLGISAKQIARALDSRDFLIRTEEDRLTTRKQFGGKSLNGYIIHESFLNADLS